MSNKQAEELMSKKQVSKKRKCDIVIPVYNAFNCLERCIDSVLKNTSFDRCRLIIIDDKSSDGRVLPLLRTYKRKNTNRIVLLENEKNLGFVKTVNKGMKYSNNDILLLNSDTVVSDGWLDRIIICGETSEDIATVTPFSNNLTPMKPLPERFRKKGFPDGYNLEWMAELVQGCSMKKYPELPSAHGFCMYIKRDVLKKVGYFDEERFGRGYGEENDFCFRCFEYGYKHVLCDDVFVFHEGTQSFLGDKKLHNDELVKKHPEVMNKVSQWYEKQNTRVITDNIELAIGMYEKRANFLVLAVKDLDEKDKTKINQLRRRYNIHVLGVDGNSYKLHSFFKEVDLDTAIYEKPVVISGKDTDSLSFKRMIEELKDIFGISFVINGSELRNELNDLLDGIMIKKSDYVRAKIKMLECDFVKSIGKEIRESEPKKLSFNQNSNSVKKRVNRIKRLPRIINRFVREKK